MGYEDDNDIYVQYQNFRTRIVENIVSQSFLLLSSNSQLGVHVYPRRFLHSRSMENITDREVRWRSRRQIYRKLESAHIQGCGHKYRTLQYCVYDSTLSARASTASQRFTLSGLLTAVRPTTEVLIALRRPGRLCKVRHFLRFKVSVKELKNWGSS
jgi:hypothetical protein